MPDLACCMTWRKRGVNQGRRVGTSLEDLKKFPDEVQDEVGYLR